MQSLRGGERLRGTDWGIPVFPPSPPDQSRFPPTRPINALKTNLRKYFGEFLVIWKSFAITMDDFTVCIQHPISH